jgi:hypothetical protein
VVVVGSGSGGGVIAGELATARAGRRRARGGWTPRGRRLPRRRAVGAEGAVLARRPQPHRRRQRRDPRRRDARRRLDHQLAELRPAARPVRELWATEHGLDGLDGPSSTSTSTRCSSASRPPTRLHRPQRRQPAARRRRRRARLELAPGAPQHRPATYSPETAGHVGYGDRTGSKQGTLRTYLRDAERGGGPHRDPRPRHPGPASRTVGPPASRPSCAAHRPDRGADRPRRDVVVACRRARDPRGAAALGASAAPPSATTCGCTRCR